MFWRLVKTLLFTLVMPGTVGVYLPQALRSDQRVLPLPVRFAGIAVFACGAAIYFWCA